MQYMCNYRITEKSELTVKIRKLQRMLNEEVTVMGSDRAKIGRLLSDIKSADAALKQVCLQFENVEVMESFAKRLRQASVETGNHHQERAKQHIATDTSEEEGSRAKVPAGLGHVKRMGTIKDFASNQNRMDEEEAKLEPSKAWWRDKDQVFRPHVRPRICACSPICGCSLSLTRTHITDPLYIREVPTLCSNCRFRWNDVGTDAKRGGHQWNGFTDATKPPQGLEFCLYHDLLAHDNPDLLAQYSAQSCIGARDASQHSDKRACDDRNFHGSSALA